MGASYTSHHVRATSSARVIEALNGLITEPAFVSDASGGWVSVFCEETEGQADEPIHSIGKHLSRELEAPTFAFLVHDSDIFCYWLYERGNVQDEYNSCPDYFDEMMEDLDEQMSADAKAEYRLRSRGRPEAVLPYGVPGTSLDDLEAILNPSERYIFAEQQAADFGALLGLKNDGRTQVGFKYVSQGDADFSQALISPETLSQDYLNRKLWGIECIHQPDVMRGWLAKGADPNARDGAGRAILFHKAEYCLVGEVRALIEAGADVNVGLDQYHEYSWERGVTPLMAAASAWQLDGAHIHAARQEETVRLLIEAGADVNARSEMGRTALKAATGFIHPARAYLDRFSRPIQPLQNDHITEMLRAAGAVE